VQPIFVLFLRQATAKGLKMSLNTERLTLSQEILVVQDRLRLQQVLANLISNAVKYSRKGSIEIRVKAVEEVVRKFSIKVID